MSETLNKRLLSALPRKEATDAMMKKAGSLKDIQHIITAELIEGGNVIAIYAYNVEKLSKGNKSADFRAFLSKDDYITQDLTTEKTRWLTGSLDSLYIPCRFQIYEYKYDYKAGKGKYTELVYIRSAKEKGIIRKYFKKYERKEDRYKPWGAIKHFQQEVKNKRLQIRHKKETDPIDKLMDTVKEPPEEFKAWIWEEAMGFSRYLAYTPMKGNKGECTCSYCKKWMIVDRSKMRLRNNEKGVCPKCGSGITIKAKGKMAEFIRDERYIAYIDPREEGFLWRYFRAVRRTERSRILKTEDLLFEEARIFYTFKDGKPQINSYVYEEFKQTGKIRWCHDTGRFITGCILYPKNLPGAWENTPLKYSALEILAKNIPTTALNYEAGIKRFIEFPALEWMIKMGLNQIARDVIDNGYYRDYSGRLNYEGKTIFKILKLTKENTRILQEIDGSTDELRLLQAAETLGLNFKPAELREYSETFGCNTELLEKTKRKASLHKIVKYITRESENYPIGERRHCWQYAYMRYEERDDPRKEKKQNLARDWIEYIGWCKEMKYDLDSMFIYMPKNFKKVHDRTVAEYQAFQDKKIAAEKKRLEARAKRAMEETKKALSEILQENKKARGAFSIKGRGLILVIPKDGEDIRREGRALHHCVGTYVERVAKGETAIFFIRKADAPEKPYYTMEWKNNKVWQCRGVNNKDMTPEVKAFTKAFETKMLEKTKVKTIKKAKTA